MSSETGTGLIKKKKNSQLISKVLKGSIYNVMSPKGVCDLSFICTFVFTYIFYRPLLLFGDMTLYAHESSTTVIESHDAVQMTMTPHLMKAVWRWPVRGRKGRKRMRRSLHCS